MRTIKNLKKIITEPRVKRVAINIMQPEQSQLGKRSTYITQYQPDLLFPILRKKKRDEIEVPTPLPFKGYDAWNAYELSWLNVKGKPMVAMGTIIIPAQSPFLMESKSLKLYFNSFNQTHFSHITQVENIIAADLSNATGTTVSVNLTPLNQAGVFSEIASLSGDCIDDLDINVTQYTPQPQLLKTEKIHVTETLHSHLLKSNCLVTGQPDWGSIEITYSGSKIDRVHLLQYLIGFRQHNEFHEQCIERIFMDIQRHCRPTSLTVYARYTRRGGIDINPLRTNANIMTIKNSRLVRQ